MKLLKRFNRTEKKPRRVLLKGKHLAGMVQLGWLGGIEVPKPRPITCPNCGTDMKRSFKRACSRLCFARLKERDQHRKTGAL